MIRLAAGILCIILSASLLAVAGMRTLPVYEKDLPPDEFAYYQPVPEFELVEDATFAGVIRSEQTGRLITTYDRSKPRARAACPT
jgi:hypothetical protein